MGATACGLVANLIDWIEGPRSDQGRPRCSTQAVVETLRFFLREGVEGGPILGHSAATGCRLRAPMVPKAERF
jgi:hypothetical protein